MKDLFEVIAFCIGVALIRLAAALLIASVLVATTIAGAVLIWGACK